MRSLRTLGKKNPPEKLPALENDMGILTYRKEQFASLPSLPYGNYWLFKNMAELLFKHYTEDNGKPDILHAHAAVFGGAAASELAAEFDIPLVLTEHSSGFSRKIYANWQLKLAKKAIEAASSCIAVSPSLANLLGEQFPNSKTRWKWIPNVVADRFKKPGEIIKDNRPVRFLNLALMTATKGQFSLIQAFAGLIRNDLNAELWLAGDGPMRPMLEQMAKKSGVADKIRFLGLVGPDKVPDLLSQIDIMVVSSLYETFGVVAAEALMAGVPVVATRCGGPECIVQEGDGLLVPSRQPDKLQDAMRQISERLAEYDPIAIAERARARFSGNAVASSLTREYASITSSGFPSTRAR
jgi:glycosyltransferase involved in cell wall biosynthesis